MVGAESETIVNYKDDNVANQVALMLRLETRLYLDIKQSSPKFHLIQERYDDGPERPPMLLLPMLPRAFH